MAEPNDKDRLHPIDYDDPEWQKFSADWDAQALKEGQGNRRRKKIALPATTNGHAASTNGEKFICGGEGQIIRVHPENIRIALRGLGIVLKQNDFTGAPEIYGMQGATGELTDPVANRIRFFIGETFCFLPPKELFEDVLTDIAHLNRFHPVREWLDTVEWDGRPRIDDWLIRYGGAENTPFNRAVGRVFLVAGVRRVRRPGCKFDTMLVLEGPQGRNKSQAAEALAMKRHWFTDGLSLDADPKVVIEQTKGSWIIEFAELTGMHTRGLERIKAFLSRNVDKARAAYGRRAQAIPRQFVGIGTTNDRQYMRKDERRLWPVLIHRFDLDALRRDVPQLWAEAANYEAEGEEITLQEDLWESATEARVERIIGDPVQEMLTDVFGEEQGWVTTKSVWSILNIPIERRPFMATAVGNAMSELRFTVKQVGKIEDERGKRGTRYYERGKTDDERNKKLYFWKGNEDDR
jgi:predicted P-loop ATPase